MIKYSNLISQLDRRKVKSSQKILDLLNKERTAIAIKGSSGSGKTTVFNEAYEQFRVKKTFSNTLCKTLLYLSLSLWTVIYSRNKINNINRRISIRNEVKIEINL